MTYLGAILGRKEDCPDYEEIVNRMKPDVFHHYKLLCSQCKSYTFYGNLKVIVK